MTPGPDATEISGGALSIPVPAGYSADTSYAAAFTFADQLTPLQKVIEQAGSGYGWVSIYGVGGLRKANGNDAFQIISELRVDDPDLKVEGDVAEVIVVDMGNPDMFGLYITVVPIGDQKLIRQQEAMVGKITVD